MCSYIISTPSHKEGIASPSTVAGHTSETSTTEFLPTLTSHSKTTELGETTITKLLTLTETAAAISKTAAMPGETVPTQIVTPPSENVARTSKEVVSIGAEVTHLFTVNITALLRPEQAFLYTNGTHVAAGCRGLIVSIAFYKPESPVPNYEIVPIGEHSPTIILADYVYVSNSLTLLVVKLSKVLHTVNPGTYTVVVWSGHLSNAVNVLECRAIVEQTKILFDDIEIRGKPVKISCSMAGKEDSAGYLTSLVCYYNL